MAVEIERKFLVISDAWKEQVSRFVLFRQGYLTQSNDKTTATSSVRVRIEGDQANLNIKSMTLGVQRLEYEYSIPLAEANEMLDKLCTKPLIEKTRHYIQHGEHTWELDVFMGDNAGLIVAEIELASEDEVFMHPAWLGAEVSQHERYYNVCLTNYPYSQWTDVEQQGR
jgi:adenylate cyclase